MERQIFSIFSRFILVAALLVGSAAAMGAKPKRVLIVSSTLGFRHSSIPLGQKILKELGEKDGGFMIADIVDGGGRPQNSAQESAWAESVKKLMAEKMNPEALAQYDAVVFLSTTGRLPLPDQKAMLDLIKSGKAFIGIHAAADTFHTTDGSIDPYIDMLGGEFKTHGVQVTVECLNQDPQHPATRNLGESFWVYDEIYQYKNFFRDRVHGLLTMDKHPNNGAPGDYPVSWCKLYGKGRVFYSSLGHREDVWENLSYQKHVLGGIRWALGLDSGDAKPQDLHAKLSRQEQRDGFHPLFSGVDLAGWHLRNDQGNKSWSAQNSMLVNQVSTNQHGTDLVSDAKFRNFTIRYEYMVPKSSNSGLYLRGRHEIQIFEDFGVTDLQPGNNGGIYSIAAPIRNVSRKAGQWQEAEATIKGNRVSVMLNGVKIHDNVEVNKATGSELDQNLDQPGPVLLQGDHGAIAFRNIRIKELK